MLNKQKLIENLLSLGLKSGDILLVKADLGKIGLISGTRKDYLDAFLEVLGPSGTLISPSFSRFSIFPSTVPIFERSSKPYACGAIANMMVRHPRSIRSLHPTNSFVAIGSYAEEILRGHDDSAPAYAPVGKILEMNGKMVLIGTLANGVNPGFLTRHYYERELGLHRRSMLRFLFSNFYVKEGQKLKYKRSDPGLCIRPADKLYAEYIKSEKLIQGYVGSAYSILMDANAAAKIDRCYMEKYPRKATICSDFSCVNCAMRWDNFWRIPFVMPLLLKKLIMRKR